MTTGLIRCGNTTDAANWQPDKRLTRSSPARTFVGGFGGRANGTHPFLCRSETHRRRPVGGGRRVLLAAKSSTESLRALRVSADHGARARWRAVADRDLHAQGSI